TIVFLTGTFTEPTYFNSVATAFKKVGYSTIYASVPSLNLKDLSRASTLKDAEYVQNNSLLPLLKGRKDIIIFTYSYRGVVRGATIVGLSK
ncbi:hypothetical protein P154DRAFT_438170, partial [Amniculicola lignicola CBS 123094]